MVQSAELYLSKCRSMKCRENMQDYSTINTHFGYQINLAWKKYFMIMFLRLCVNG